MSKTHIQKYHKKLIFKVENREISYIQCSFLLHRRGNMEDPRYCFKKDKDLEDLHKYINRASMFLHAATMGSDKDLMKLLYDENGVVVELTKWVTNQKGIHYLFLFEKQHHMV